MTAFPLHRRYLPISAGLLSLFVASCKSTSTKPGYGDVVDYTSPNTGLSQEEYPFDKNGNYLADVVSGKTKGKPASSAPIPMASAPQTSYVDTYEKPVITAVDTPSAKPNPIYDRVPEPDSNQPSASSGGGSPSSKPKTSPSTASASKPKPKPSTVTASSKTKAKPVPAPVKPKASSTAKTQTKPKAPATISYTVKRGDTLYGLASRYGTSVQAIKQANGLSSNVLQDGRSLRIPRK